MPGLVFFHVKTLRATKGGDMVAHGCAWLRCHKQKHTACWFCTNWPGNGIWYIYGNAEEGRTFV